MKTFWKIPVFFFVCGFLGPWASATVVKRRPRFPVNSIPNGENELCPKVRIGQDDLPGFDLISQFQVDKAASTRSIQRIVGSTALQVAYKLGTNVDFRIPTRHLYPSGLPEEYSFLTTFRMTGSTLEKSWNIWQIQDSSGKEQVGVKINGQTKSVAFSYKGLDGSLQSADFSNLPSLFDSQWHKIMIGVERSSATLFVDCNRIESLPIKPRGQINVDGFAVLGKLADNPQVSVPTLEKVFLQLMSYHTSSGWVRKPMGPLLSHFEFYAVKSLQWHWSGFQTTLNFCNICDISEPRMRGQT